jgi:hypothetical protein
MFSDSNPPTLLTPVYAYTGDTPAAVGKPVPPISSTNASSTTGGVNPSTTPSSNLDITGPGDPSMIPSHPVDASGNSLPHTDPSNAVSISYSSSYVPTPASSSTPVPQLPSFGSPPASTGPRCKTNHKRSLRNVHAYHQKGRRLMKSHGWGS